MKLRRLQIFDIEYKPLMKGVDIFFTKSTNDSINVNCLVGVNGSGKSQLLELISEIFLFLDKVYRKQGILSKKINSPFAFKIEYEITINEILYLVSFECEKIHTKPKDILFEIIQEDIPGLVIDTSEIVNYLPNKVIGYTSGDNETLSLPFEWYYDEYADFTGKRARFPEKYKEFNDYDPVLYFMNYNTNLGITISNLIFDDGNDALKLVKDIVRVEKLISFRITIQTNQKMAPGYKPKGGPDAGIKLTEELENWIDKLIKCCKYAVQDENDKKFKRWILDYELDPITIDLFKIHFSSALELYTAFYKLELLNNLIIKDEIVKDIKRARDERLNTALQLVPKLPTVPDEEKVLRYSELKLMLKNGTTVDYLSLSDGEHQFLNVFGTILMMINQENCLFLLDEPETHFNPKWRRIFISTLKEMTIGKIQDMIVTTHSPFVVSDCKNESVFIFERDGDCLRITNPPKETYGASFDNILDMAFDIKIPISRDSLKEIDELRKYQNPDVIKEKLNNFGESDEKLNLMNRIIMLNFGKEK
ncbi:restriction system-associated AAA family ATPase [Chryseobacterium rhizosphaerae]|uniref:ATPase AAA-type core domain-containing protein n=1 Tax=Chryseobacterium rhizosphaerae TaxID=395937 RepID=A0ABX9IN57_9FLAO|nr:restriction system-associated AAA family ATPase [Chryseobacterium rhizosphaerae]REC75904.1 hypothetical protein DRF57_09050 [Chryseobacterium rhizosphaerae]GEN67170.1 ABC transporter [Chryseobacterium rhizosphaerae]